MLGCSWKKTTAAEFTDLVKLAFGFDVTCRSHLDFMVTVEDDGEPAQMAACRRMGERGIFIVEAGGQSSATIEEKRRYFERVVDFLHEDYDFIDADIVAANRDWLLMVLMIGFLPVGRRGPGRPLRPEAPTLEGGRAPEGVALKRRDVDR